MVFLQNHNTQLNNQIALLAISGEQSLKAIGVLYGMNEKAVLYIATRSCRISNPKAFKGILENCKFKVLGIIELRSYKESFIDNIKSSLNKKEA